MNDKCSLRVKQAEEKEPVMPGVIYFAPPNYHLLIEMDRTFSLSVEARVNYARPAIDVLFETAAEVYGSKPVGVILTGASADGAKWLMKIKAAGGITVVKDPRTAEAEIMPESATSAGALPVSSRKFRSFNMPISNLMGSLLKMKMSIFPR